MIGYFGSPFLGYVKKEDAGKVLDQQKKSVGIIFPAMILVVVLMELFVVRKVRAVYQDLGVPVPPVTQAVGQFGTFGAVILLFVSWRFLIQPPDYDSLNKRLTKYQSGDLVPAGEIIDRKNEAAVLIIIGLVVGVLVISVILPIFNLAGNFS